MSDDPVATHTRRAYVAAVLALYVSLPETPYRACRTDQRLAGQFYDRAIPLDLIEGALLLASVRRGFRPPAAPKLSPIRSLQYFVPVIDELVHTRLPSEYLDYLRHKMRRLRASADRLHP
jgi:hypothetical protein